MLSLRVRSMVLSINEQLRSVSTQCPVVYSINPTQIGAHVVVVVPAAEKLGLISTHVGFLGERHVSNSKFILR